MPQCRLLASHQSLLVRLLLISVAASVVDISTPVPVAEHQEIVEVTLIEEAWNSDHRTRRDADSDLPDRLTFSIPVASDRAVIRMARSRLLPVIMSDEESTRDANSFIEDAAVYTNIASSSSMIVKRDSGNYMLRGTFVHQDVAWTLHYETRHKRDADNIASMPHRISPFVAPKRSLPGDKAEYSPELRARRAPLETSTSRMGPLVTEKNATRKRPTQHVVEIAFIVDNADYNKWVKYVGLDNTSREMRLWYTYVAESINIRYQNIKDPDIAIRTTVTVLRILSNTKDGTLFSNQITNGLFDARLGLDVFINWYLKQRDLPRSDHYMLFTGLKLKAHKGEKLPGTALEAELCTNESVSICQNGFSENTGYTAAHELGHSLSAVHERNTGGKCSDLYIMNGEDKFPMNADQMGNNWQFSPCSIADFKSFLASVNCTRETSTVKPELTAPPPGQRAGEVLSRDEQCKLAFQNRSSYFCEAQHKNASSIEELCGGMACFKPVSQTCSFIRPQEYTPCGVNKWCRSGRCVVNDELTTTTSKTISTAPTAATTVVRPSSTIAATTVVPLSSTTAATTVVRPSSPAATTVVRPSPTTSATTVVRPSPTTSATTVVQPSSTTAATTVVRPSPTTAATTVVPPSPTTAATTVVRPSSTTAATTVVRKSPTTAATTVVRPSPTTAATSVVRPSSTAAGTATTTRLPCSSSSQQPNNVTTTTFKPTTKPPARSCLSTLPSSATTIVSVTFGLCLFFCSAV